MRDFDTLLILIIPQGTISSKPQRQAARAVNNNGGMLVPDFWSPLTMQESVRLQLGCGAAQYDFELECDQLFIFIDPTTSIVHFDRNAGETKYRT